MVRPPMHLLLSAEIRVRDARVSLFIPFPTTRRLAAARSRTCLSGCGPCVTRRTRNNRTASLLAKQFKAWRASRRRAKGNPSWPAAGGGLDLGLDHAHCRWHPRARAHSRASSFPSPLPPTATQASTHSWPSKTRTERGSEQRLQPSSPGCNAMCALDRGPLVRRRAAAREPAGTAGNQPNSQYSHAHRPAGPPAARRALWLIRVVAAPPGLRQIYLPVTQRGYLSVCRRRLFSTGLCSLPVLVISLQRIAVVSKAVVQAFISKFSPYHSIGQNLPQPLFSQVEPWSYCANRTHAGTV